MRLRILTSLAVAGVMIAPSPSGAEAFATFWQALGPGERDFVDEVAAGLYGEERGASVSDYSRLNAVSRIRYRMRAMDILGVKNRPDSVRTKNTDV